MRGFNVRAFEQRALPEALELIRSIVSSSPRPLKIQEIYQLATQQRTKDTVQHVLRPDYVPAGTPLPPHPEHPIRSLNYLKRVILPSLAQARWIEKVHKLREMTTEERAARKDLPKSARRAADEGMAHEWVWQRRIVQIPNPPRVKPVFGKEVGVGEDFSHLNKRRQRSRQESIGRDVSWLRELEQARREGARAGARRS